MPKLLKIALLQLVSCGRDSGANLEKGDRYCRAAASAGADVALFPEMWSIGYQPFDPERPDDRESWLSLAVRVSDPFVQHFRKLARELDVAIGITYLGRGDGAPRNTLTLFDRHGEEALTYSKVHLGPWNPPDNVCAAGNIFPVCSLDTAAGPVRLGAMICFDREFPETARMLMLNGAEVILTPNACDLNDQKGGVGDIRIAQFRARAFENLVAVAMANYAAPQHDGHSVAFYPDGAVIVKADSVEQIVLAEIDLDRVRRYRDREASRDAARSPEKYRAIASAEHPRPLGFRSGHATLIRREEPEDAAPVRTVNQRAFGRANEAALVDALRGSAGAISLVATVEGRVVGHILFTPVSIEGTKPSAAGAGLAPMAVLPEYQNRGIGSQLVRGGLSACESQGYGFTVVLGHPHYYPRFGFVPASTKGLAYEEKVPQEVFMLLELRAGALEGARGIVRYRPEFGAL